MAFLPIAYVLMQYDKIKLKNWWLKAYEPGTTTAKAMATDETASSTASRYELNAEGFPVTAGGANVIPFIDGAYDLWLFPTASDADNNDTTNAEQFADNIDPSGGNQEFFSTSGDIILTQDQVDGLTPVSTGEAYTGQFLKVTVNGTETTDYTVTGDYEITLTAGVFSAGDTLVAEQNSDDVGTIDSQIVRIDNITDLTSSNLRAGMRVSTTAYSAGWAATIDGPRGGADYSIVSQSDFGGTPDGYGDHYAGNTSQHVALLDKQHVFIEQYGADHLGAADSSSAINAGLAANNKVHAGSGTFKCLSQIDYIRERSIVGSNETVFQAATDGMVLFNLFEVLYCHGADFSIDIAANNVTAFKLSSDAGTPCQLNKFYNINVEGNLRSGTLSVLFESVSFTNQFYSCNFFRTQDGVQFGESGVGENAVNANHFFGCELRSVNTDPNSGRAIIHHSGDNNAFFGGAIENWLGESEMNGGSLLLDSVYLEAFAGGAAFYQYGGRLKLHKCFRENSVRVFDGESLSIIDPDLIASGTWTDTYPMIQYRADVATKLTLISDIDEADVILHRAGQWRDGGGAWAYRTTINERVSWLPSIFNIRMAADAENVTGNAEDYQINFGNNKEFDYHSETNNSGVFTAKQFGIWKLEANITLSGLSDDDRIEAWIETTDRIYYIARQDVATGMLINDDYTIQGDARARMEKGDTATVHIKVTKSVPATTVDVIRGDAANAFTSFSGAIDRG